MTATEKKIIFDEMRRMMSDFKEEIKREIRSEMKQGNRDLRDILIGLGIMDPDEKLLTKAQVMETFRIGKTKLEQLMADGTIPFSKSGTSQQSRVTFRYADVRIGLESLKR